MHCLSEAAAACLLVASCMMHVSCMNYLPNNASNMKHLDKACRRNRFELYLTDLAPPSSYTIELSWLLFQSPQFPATLVAIACAVQQAISQY